jgi:3-hydroxyisobutyrate dehydrogenase-like beta-hydroxyacid dehydrogenase
MASKPKLGYLGLGLMGSQMTKRLIKNGYQVTAINLSGSSRYSLNSDR